MITRPGESCRLWRVVVCDQKTSKIEEAKACYRAVKIQPQWIVTPGKQQQTYVCNYVCVYALLMYVRTYVWMLRV